jgi:hypothetical protein
LSPEEPLIPAEPAIVDVAPAGLWALAIVPERAPTKQLARHALALAAAPALSYAVLSTV